MKKYIEPIIFFCVAIFVFVTQLIWYIVDTEFATYLAGIYATILTVGLLVICGCIVLNSIRKEKQHGKKRTIKNSNVNESKTRHK